ncbi:MAG: formimidoylglutamase [Marinilabiliaceae bacterium]|nr:formimidoylglutamase [Marinilabiliaceae bacterium]
MFERYKTVGKEIWTGRVDSTEDMDAFRWHQIIRSIDLREMEALSIDPAKLNVCFLGFCCDEGVIRNLGRPGARKGPRTIRRELANWPVNFLPEAQLYDAGNIVCGDKNLEAAQQELANAVQMILEAGLFPILLGGGHEIALGHFNGIKQHFDATGQLNQAPGIINFDAHLDLRPFDNGGSSGTMFNQIHSICKAEDRPYSYLCIGPQTYSNTRSLFKRADDMGAKYILAKDIKQECYPEVLSDLYQFINHQEDLYLTLCTDVLNAAHAPGVSAVQPFGLDPEMVLSMMKQIIRTGKVRSIDIAEVSPRFDSDNQTAKLVAVFIYGIVNTLLEIRKQAG